MSAIAGIYHLNKEPVPIEHSRNLMSGLQQFPADDVQMWHKENIFLGCHAQWITPESVGERLPYYDRERMLAITADAIIDNRHELYESLQIKQSYRKKISDSELILRAYEKWGEEVPKYLLGDFAFMIWDERKHLLFGARDFSGSRTLYYYHNKQQVAFCTTIRPLFSLPYVAKILNEQWLAEFLAIPEMFETVDISSTVFRNINQVPPSHSISISNGRVTLSQYNVLTIGEQLRLKSSQEYVEAFREVFREAVGARLRTYRQVGAYLSGGLDSGSVVSFAAQLLRKENKQLHSFSYFPVEDFMDWTPKSRMADERPLIKAIVQHVGNIRDHYFSFAGRSPLSEIDEYLETLEMPYKFFLNTFWLKGIYEEAQGQGIGILLNGERGNFTISWGPALDYYAVLLKNLRLIHLYRELTLYSKNSGIKKSRIFSTVRKKAFPFMEEMFPGKARNRLPMLVSPMLAKMTNVFDKLQEHGIDVTGSYMPNAYAGRKLQFEQLNFWHNGTGKTKFSLRYSLLKRDPTNDLRVIRFCLSVPDEQYVQNGLDRALIRRSTEGYLPDSVRLNQRIRGIQGADGVYRMTSAWNRFIQELEQMIKDNDTAGFLNMEVVRAAFLKIRQTPRPDYVFDPEFKTLMVSLIVYRFIKRFT